MVEGVDIQKIHHILGFNDESEVRRVMETLKPEAIVGANDRTAGHLMHALIRLGYRVPEDVRIVGIDDVAYANLLPVPLTTVHQPCRQIGVAAMLERVTNPDMPVWDILLDCRLVIRHSCGAISLHTISAAAESATPTAFLVPASATRARH